MIQVGRGEVAQVLPQADPTSPGVCGEENPAGWTLVHTDSQILHFKPPLVPCSEISSSWGFFWIFQKINKNLLCHPSKKPKPLTDCTESQENSPAPNFSNQELSDLKQNIFPSSSLAWRSGIEDFFLPSHTKSQVGPWVASPQKRCNNREEESRPCAL